jgi:hypothetical protein
MGRAERGSGKVTLTRFVGGSFLSACTQLAKYLDLNLQPGKETSKGGGGKTYIDLRRLAYPCSHFCG